MKITIINAYGDNNIGDATILKVALDIVGKAYTSPEVSVHCENKKATSKFVGKKSGLNLYQLPYGYIIDGKSRAGAIKKISKFIEVYLLTYFYLFLDKYLSVSLPKNGFYSYIKDIKKSDLVLGMGGGYFIAKEPVRDYFGLMLSLLPVYIAKLYKKKIIFFPISFGPFASSIQEKIAFNAIKGSTVMARDEITLKTIESLGGNSDVKVFYAPDLALFFNNHKYSVEEKIKSGYLVLTAREWLAQKKQADFEKSLGGIIKYARDKYKLKTVFVAMARNPLEDDDNRLAERLKKNLPEDTFTIYSPKSLVDLQGLLGRSRLAICTRMHSAILSITVRSPFIAVGYSHKTLGLVKSYDASHWYVDIEKATFKRIQELLDQLLERDNYKSFIKNLDFKQKNKEVYLNKIIHEITY